MYRIDFVDINTSEIISRGLHDGLDNIELSPVKISASDDFTHEPLRLSFELIADDSLIQTLLDENNEIYPYISKYLVKFYKNNELSFTGFIDTSFLEFDRDYLLITAYSFLKLLKSFNFLKTNESLTLTNLITNFKNNINNLSGLNITTSFLNNNLVINKNELQLDRCLISSRTLNSQFANYITTFTNDKGFISHSDHLEFRYIFYRVKAYPTFNFLDYTEQTYDCTLYADIRKIKIYNHICFEIETETINVDKVYNSIQNAIDNKFLLDARLKEYYPPNTNNWVNDLEKTFEDRTYFYQSDVNANNVLIQTFGKLIFSGNIIPSILNMKEENYNYFDALKIFLLLHNLTLFSNKNGELILKNNIQDNTVLHPITDADICYFSKKRRDSQLAETEIIDDLKGDTTILKNEIMQYYRNLYANKWEYTINIDNYEREINIFDKIQVFGEELRVIEISNDFQNEELILKAEK